MKKPVTLDEHLDRLAGYGDITLYRSWRSCQWTSNVYLHFGAISGTHVSSGWHDTPLDAVTELLPRVRAAYQENPR